MNYSFQELYSYIYENKLAISTPSAAAYSPASTATAKQTHALEKRKTEIRKFFLGEGDKPGLFSSPVALSAFRDFLRTQAKDERVGTSVRFLEETLFGNVTDELKDSSTVLPRDEKIAQIFDESKIKLFFTPEQIDKARTDFIKLYKVAKIVGDLIEENNSLDDSVAIVHACKMLVVFGGQGNVLERVDRYFKNFFNNKNSTKPLHNALLHNLPAEEKDTIRNFHLAEWQASIQKCGPRVFKYFEHAVKIEKYWTPPRAPRTSDEALIAFLNLNYARANENLELASLCFNYKILEKDFNKCLEVLAQRKHQEEEEKKLHENKLPDVVIDGAEVEHPGYFLVKLPTHDLRGFLLGKITNCCQSIGGDSEKCVIDGMTRTHNGFYVLLKSKEVPKKELKAEFKELKAESEELKAESKELKEVSQGGAVSSPAAGIAPFVTTPYGKKINDEAYEIVGQGYAWLTRYGNLTFDSWENLTPSRDDLIIVPMLRKFGEKITNVSDSDLVRMTIGVGGRYSKTPKGKGGFGVRDLCIWPEIMYEGRQYIHDSVRQFEVYRNKEKLRSSIAKIKTLLAAFQSSECLRAVERVLLILEDIGSIHLINLLTPHISDLIKDMDYRNITDVSPAYVVAFLHLKNEGFYDDIDVRSAVLKNPDDVSYILNNFRLLKEERLDNVPDVRAAVLKKENIESARTIFAAYKLLNEKKLEKVTEVRAAVLNRPRDSATIFSEWKLLEDEKITQPDVRAAVLNRPGNAVTILANLKRLREEKLSEEPVFRQAVFLDNPALWKQLDALKEAKMDDLDVKLVALKEGLKGDYYFGDALDVMRRLQLSEMYSERDVRAFFLKHLDQLKYISFMNKCIEGLKSLKQEEMYAEHDVRAAILAAENMYQCDQIIANLKALKAAGMYEDPLIRKSALKHGGMLVARGLRLLIDEKLDVELKDAELNVRSVFLENPHRLDTIRKNLNLLKEEKMDKESDVRDAILKRPEEASIIIDSLKILKQNGKYADPVNRALILNGQTEREILSEGIKGMKNYIETSLPKDEKGAERNLFQPKNVRSNELLIEILGKLNLYQLPTVAQMYIIMTEILNVIFQGENEIHLRKHHPDFIRFAKKGAGKLNQFYQNTGLSLFNPLSLRASGRQPAAGAAMPARARP